MIRDYYLKTDNRGEVEKKMGERDAEKEAKERPKSKYDSNIDEKHHIVS